jgi:hypothetical protein
MKMKKRILSLSLILVLLAGLLPIHLLAPSAFGAELSFDEMLEQLREDFFGADADESPGLETIFIDDSERVHSEPEYLEQVESDDEYIDLPEQTPINYIEGSTRSFTQIRSSSSWNCGHTTSPCTHTGTLVKQGDHVNIWTLNGTPATPTASELNTLIAAFDGIFNRMTHAETGFGAFKGVRISTRFTNVPLIGDVNQDGRINAVLYSERSSGRFSNGNFFNTDNIPIAMFHMNFTGTTMGTENNRFNFYSTFAHEFQHMLFYMYFSNYAPDSSVFLWINEALSELAGGLYSVQDAEVTSTWRALNAAENPYSPGSSGYGDFLNFNGSFKNYGMGAMHSLLMHRRTSGTYGSGMYKYFREFLPISTSPALNSANANKFSGTTMSTIIGDAFRSAGLMGDLTGTGATAFNLLYYLFMEAFAADGGSIVNGENRLTPQKFHQNTTFSAFNLWGIRPALGEPVNTTLDTHRIYTNSFSTIALNSDVAIPSLTSASGQISLRGYDRGASPPAASHEMMYRLGQNTTNTTLRISVNDNNANTRFYVAVPKEMPDTAINIRRGQHGADVYPLLNNNRSNDVPTNGRVAYLYVVTLNRDVSDARATFSWQAPPSQTFTISATPAAPSFGSLAVGYTQPAVQTVTVRNTGTGNVTLNALPSVANYTLVQGANWTTAMAPDATRTFTISPNASLAAGSYNRTVTITGSGGASASINPTFTVTGGTGTAPSITTQPQDQFVSAGQNATFTVAATGTPAPSYQWWVWVSGTWSIINGATNPTLTLTNVTTSMSNNWYSCFIHNSASNPAAELWSQNVRLGVNVPAAVTITATPGDGEYVVNWAIPNNGGSIITGYEFRQRIGSGDWGNWLALTGNNPETWNRATFSERINGTTYSVQIRAVNANGAGPASNIVTVTPTASTGPTPTPIPMAGVSRPFPQEENFNYAISRVTPNNRTQPQMNQDVIDQFIKILPDFVVDPHSGTRANPDRFRMVLRHLKGTGSSDDIVTSSESMGYGMLMLAYMAGSENVMSGGKTVSEHLRDNLPSDLRAAFGSRQVTVRDYFDGLFRCLREFPSYNINTNGTLAWNFTSGRRTYLMSWELLSVGRSGDPNAALTTQFTRPALSDDYGPSSATDGDMDMAYALLLAQQQWGTSAGEQGVGYGYWARGMINDLWLVCVDRGVYGTPARYHLYTGNWVSQWGRPEHGHPSYLVTRPSDMMLGHLRAFREVDTTLENGVNRWQRVINATEAGIEQIYSQNNPRTGVLPDFVRVNQSNGQWMRVNAFTNESPNDGNHWHNSCRVPWRLGVDLLTHGGNAGVKNLHDNGLQHLHTLFRTTGSPTIRGGNAANPPTFAGIRAVNFNGTHAFGDGWYPSGIAFAAPVLTAATAYGNAAWMADGWQYSRSRSRGADPYYGDYLNVLSMIAASGNWWCPVFTTFGSTVTTTAWSVTPVTTSSTPFVLESATVGYGVQTPRNIMFSNSGTVALNVTGASFTSGGASFEIFNAPTSTVPVGTNTGVMTVRPRTGLAAGTYTGTVTITTSNGVPSSIAVHFSFTVNPSGPDGTAGNPFLVASVADLQRVGTGNNGWNLSSHYRQTANINLSSVSNWIPIGDGLGAFTGVYNGNGFTISNLTSNWPGYDYSGLFLQIGIAGIVRNVGLVGGSVSGDDYVGGITGANFGTIENCWNTGTVSGVEDVGGIVGGNSGIVDNCIMTGTVSFTIWGGGIVGYNYAGGAIRNSHSLGQSLTASILNAGRVTGAHHNGASGSNNRAWAGMTVNGATVTNGTLTNKDGLNIDTTAARELLTVRGIPIPPHLQGVLLGNVTGSGTVGPGDLVRFARWLVGDDVELCEEAADITGSGNIGLADILRLARWLAGHFPGQTLEQIREQLSP